MNDRGAFRPVRLAADAVAGLALFLLMAGLLTGTCNGNLRMSDFYMGQAQAAHLTPALSGVSWAQQTPQTVPLAMIRSYPGQVFRSTDRTTAFIVLGMVFTLLFAANSALYRHLRAQYGVRRRRRLR